jgi:arsenite transporter
MSVQCEVTAKQAAGAAMNVFERWLSLWVALCIVVGIALGQFLPAPFHFLGELEVAQVNLPVGVLIWIMIIPMLIKIDFGALHQVRDHWKGIGVTLFVNWAVKPFSMALLAWLFIRGLFADWLPAEQLDSYVAGLILLAAAPCTAMVFVWSRLTGGDPYFTLSQVALNDAIMIVAFAPIVGLLLGLSAIVVPWDTLLISVLLYIVIPVIVAQVLRKILLAQGQARFDAVLDALGHASIVALLLTLVLLFAFQGEQIIAQPLIIALLAVPILIQVFFNSALAYWLNRVVGEKHSVACPSALIGASNFFELAVAAAIALFGFQSGAALATVVGVLIEVPVMLLVVRVVNRSKGWYEAGARPENSIIDFILKTLESAGETRMKTLEIFDPAMCCSTGVCGVDVDPALVQCQADLLWLAEQGVRVDRHNLSQNPQAFTTNPVGDQGAGSRHGVSAADPDRWPDRRPWRLSVARRAGENSSV